ncbi:hypothetical protein PpBr36_02090 [Pyricularia pennisetigena]|uniref:hypothetical protein n=1 Tax=Pyricularia pennisetigena TaxID=1578925 RepID=UPI00114DA657|nr:hypothetical protein PpBr36_02090 [Pyricularia pennisetigena]TLS28786.1 hypothetical protein PpBr36_02090 [Pyricularia pennisetigena]
MTHGIGMQQHETPSHSKHLLCPEPPPGLMMDEAVEDAALPGPLASTGPARDAEQAIFLVVYWGAFGGEVT